MEPKPTTPQKAQIAVTDEGVALRTIDEVFRFAEAVHQSRLAPKQFDSPQAILVAIQHGLEIGLKPMQALQSIAVINGRPCIWGDGALALVVSKPDFEDIEETFNADGTEAKCTIKRKGRTPVVRTFSMADAKLAGLLGKPGPWTQYLKLMLQMRARGFAMRDAFPDALKGVAVREEQEDIAPRPVQGRVVEEGAVVFADAPKPEPRDTLALEGG
jgi:hypothetical protein